MQSPSSINVYLQCPRKYFYQYKLRMPTSPSIHLVRGSVAHLVLEKMYTILPDVIADNYASNLEIILKELLKKFWEEHHEEFAELNMTDQELMQYYRETEAMLLSYLQLYLKKLDEKISQGMTFVQAFHHLSPQVEAEYLSWDHYVKGFIDVIENWDDTVRLMDYKTSKSAKMTDAYKLQLAIYALLYKTKHGSLPDEVGIYFLKHGQEMTLSVDEELIMHAQFHIEQIHMSTESDSITDYPKNETPLCKWSTGQCDFYSYCFEGKKIPEEPLPKRIYKK